MVATEKKNVQNLIEMFAVLLQCPKDSHYIIYFDCFQYGENGREIKGKNYSTLMHYC